MFRTAAVLSLLLMALASASVHAGNAANFVGADSATKGSWKGVYGGDGYVMPALTTALIQHLPSYATVTATGKQDFTFVGATTDVRALQKPGVTTDRQCGCWYADNTFDVDIVLTAGTTRRIALYCIDYDSVARAQRIDVIDPSNNSVLDTQSIAASFNGGVWMIWNITGSVKFRFTDIGTPNTVLNGIFFGGANASQTVDTVWFDDATPAGAVQQGDYTWIFSTTNPTPFSGTTASQSTVAAGTHQHYFTGANPTFRVNKGDILMSHVFLDPANPPTEVMMQWNDGVWEHRAYWGGNGVPFGVDGTNSRRYMGPLPPTGQWVRLEVPAGIVGLEDRDLNGIAFTIFDGRATWDRPGRSTPCALSISPLTPTIPTSGTQTFTSALVDINGAPLTPQTPVNYSVSGGGTITSGGLFTAGLVTGTYTVNAFTSTSTATASTTITIINRPPVAVADTLLVTQNRSRIVVAPGVLGNDTDPENDALTAVKDTDPTNGVLVLNANGSYTYTPNTNFLGADSFTYHARDSFTNDSNTVTVTITVTANVAPVVSGVVNQFTSEESPINASVTATDANGDPITFRVVTPPTKGVVTIPNPAVGNYTYTPALDATGTDTFVIGAQDDSGLVGTLTITITIQPLNDAPVAVTASLQTGNNQSKTGTLTATDVDSTVFTFAIASPPAHGTVVLTNAATGAFLYTPAADYIGADSFTFVVSDGALSSAPGTISVLVTPGPQFVSQPALTPNPVLAGQGALASGVAPTAVSITWDWGDGTTGSGSSLQHSWTTSGVYQVKVTAVGADGVATVKTVELLVAAALEGPNGGGATPPGVVGILVGGSGASTNGKGKVSCNYVRRDKTMYSGALSSIAFPSALKQGDLAGLTGTLKLGPLANPAVFRFTLNAKGKGKSTGLPQVEVNLKKKQFRFKAQRSDLTELTETLGGPREFAPSAGVTLLIPATLQIGDKLVLAMTFQVSYKQISNGGVGTLTK